MNARDDNLTLADFMPGTLGNGGTGEGADYRAERGEPLAQGANPATYDEVIAAIQTVYDPEIPINLWDLGLIYRCDVSAQGNVDIDMTLTAPGCPVAGQMPAMVADAVAKVAGVGKVAVQLVWEPGWTKERMSDDARLLLDL